jgi:membrane protein implicated in regulation of membrane protease activity
MLDLMDNTILWWHWFILGFLLLIIEIATGTFLLLSLAISAIVVGIVALIIKIHFLLQLLAFSLLSMGVVWLWRHYFRSKSPTTIGQSMHTFETLGVVTQTIEKDQRGMVRFDTPVLGNTLWVATANETIAQDQRIEIIDIHGQLIIVQPHTNN